MSKGIKIVYAITESVRLTTKMSSGTLEFRDDHALVAGQDNLALRYAQINEIRLQFLFGIGSLVHFRCEEKSVFIGVRWFSFSRAMLTAVNSRKTYAMYSELVRRVIRTSRMEPGDELIRDTEWSITYRKKGQGITGYESKFLLGTASITYTDLCLRWPQWSKEERLDFCQAFGCCDQENSAEIIRYLATDESETIRMTVALSVALRLPAEEAFPILTGWVNDAPAGRRANFHQALAHTRHPDARAILERNLHSLCEHPDLMRHGGWCNEVAFELIWCIENLLYLGAAIEPLRPAFDKLARHPSERVREHVHRWLAESFEKITPKAVRRNW